MRCIILILLAFMPGIPSAQGAVAEFLVGTWSTETGCLAIAAGDAEANPVRLTSAGFSELEWHCDFVAIHPQEQPEGWVASLMCEEPGYIYPDMVAFRFQDPATLTVSFMTDEIIARSGGTPSYAEPFIKCEAAE